MTTALRLSADEIRRTELAAFLRSRRERISPEQVGLPSGGRRRTPGLRREEVAQLAGVGVTWYTWLEQGRDIHASEQVLNAIARTLQLDPHERSHLFTLAGAPEPPMEKDCSAVSPQIRAILGQLEPFPAAVQNARTDILAYNRAYNWLMDVDSVPFEERNSMLLCFTNQRWRSRLRDWEDGMPRTVAQFRASMAEHIAEPGWKELVKRLRRESPEFEAQWNRHDVQPMRNLTKVFVHPEAGMLSFDYTHLWFGRRSEVRLTTYTPADSETAAKLHAGVLPPS
ncbi:helix-turn-helix transcriptional regulator [Amycolatopsis thermophila]|uniref:Transcriptional regulator with XRE-family HTH domain n=1 Tax=Amycolatopsis thermophila TaxID=206084 RepID=A0ABU0ET59_9PSEU|nr:helix-turn-helix transcriptional regulator [Amycolatopsis thermophila]MDQ0378100.1 transcriptional regulator with XRE-family HTH domain [Amycolatopsis thermophila]